MSVAPVISEKRLYRFDGFLVDPVRRLLSRGGEPIAITPKAFSILVVLIERRGELVEKRELLQKIWPDTYVTEANLTQNISSLRKALGERPGEHRYVATIPGRGYCFTEEIEELGEAPEVPAAEPDEPALAEALPAAVPERTERPERRWLPLAAAVLILAALAGLAALWLWRDEPLPARGAVRAGPVSRRPTIAVLGFKNNSGDRGVDWLAPALAEMITTELTAGARLRVISGEEVFLARQALSLFEPDDADQEDLDRLRARLGVDFVVRGSYVAMDVPGGEHRIRLDLKVHAVRSGEVLASLREVGTEAGLFDLVSRTGEQLRATIGIGDVSPEAVRAAQASRPASTKAARLHAEGLQLLRAFEPGRARARLEQAARADPGSARIRTDLARALAELGYEKRAAEEASKAVERSGTLPTEQRLAVEARYYELSKSWLQASEIYRSLWTYVPDEIEYGLDLASCLSRGGRGAEALQTIATLRALDPPASEDPRVDIQEAEIAQRLSDTDLQMRAARAAEEKGRRSGESFITAQALILQGAAHLVSGRAKDSLPLFQEAEALYGKAGDRWGVTTSLVYRGLTLHRMGDLAGAERDYQLSLRMAQDIGNVFGVAVQLGNLGRLYQDRGEVDLALRYLERSQSQLAEVGDKLLELRIVTHISTILAARGDLKAASIRREQALVMSRQVGSSLDEARTLATLGDVRASQGELHEALRLYGKALPILRELSHVAAAGVLGSSADVLVNLGDLAGARRRYEEALGEKQEEGDRIGAGRIVGSLARLDFLTGNLASSRARGEELLRIAAETGARPLEARALLELGRADIVVGNFAAARQRLEASLRASRAIGEILNGELTRLELIRLGLVEGRRESRAAAIKTAGDSAAWCRVRQIPGCEARALAMQVHLFLLDGRISEAQAMGRRVRALVRGSEDVVLRSAVGSTLARTREAGGDLEGTRRELRQLIAEADRFGILTASLEARMVLGQLEMERGDRSVGRRLLAAAQQEFQARGFQCSAWRSAEALAQAGTAALDGACRQP